MHVQTYKVEKEPLRYHLVKIFANNIKESVAFY